MKRKPDWLKLKKFIESKKRLLITTHVNPDGDAIGSEIAVAEYARQCGSQVFIINQDPTPEFFQFIDADNEIHGFEADRHQKLIESMDGCVVVDVSDWARLQQVGKLLRQNQIPVAVVDHHIPTDAMGQVRINLEYASSAGEALYRFLKHFKIPMSLTMVNALYLCVLTDTGSFRYSNTTPFALRMAADLLHRGADVDHINEQVYENESAARTILRGRMLADVRFAANRRLAYGILTQALLRETGAELWESEGFSELLRRIKGVEISILFSENADHSVRTSFRSKGRIPINGLAMQFGGGGHLYAAGATLNLPLADAIDKVLTATVTLLNQPDEG